MAKTIAIVHFQPLELYPPAMNFINTLTGTSATVSVFTTGKNGLPLHFRAEGIEVVRLGRQQTKSWKRYLAYLKFNMAVLLYLLVKRPGKILSYETLSVFPVYCYMKLFPKTRLCLHFHEYTSIPEYASASQYVKWLYQIEKKLYPLAARVSHTNQDRLRLFKLDHPQLKTSTLTVMANYPPADWAQGPAPARASAPIRFVYVGALSMDTMYTRNFAEWILSLSGKATWDIYTGNYSADVMVYLQQLNSPYVTMKGEVSYWELPSILSKYHIGVVLYNGHIPNYVFNIPNKVFEYLACGLEVWFSKDLQSCYSLLEGEVKDRVRALDFAALSAGDDMDMQCGRKGKGTIPFTAENETLKLKTLLLT